MGRRKVGPPIVAIERLKFLEKKGPNGNVRSFAKTARATIESTMNRIELLNHRISSLREEVAEAKSVLRKQILAAHDYSMHTYGVPVLLHEQKKMEEEDN